MNFGSRTSPEEAILSSAAEAGINFIDTADQYGGDAGVGTDETILGQWLAQTLADVTIRIATKVHNLCRAVNDRGSSARHIQKACEASLRRLQVEILTCTKCISTAAPITRSGHGPTVPARQNYLRRF